MQMIWSAARAALDSFSEARLEKRRDEGDERASGALRVLERAPRIDNALELGMLLVTLAVGAIAGAQISPRLAAAAGRCAWLRWAPGPFWAGLIHLLVAVLVLAALMAAIDAARRRATLRAAEAIPYRMLWVAGATEGLLRPLTALSALLARGLLRLMRVDPDQSGGNVTEEEILAMVDIGEEKGAIEKNEKELIENIFEFNNLTAEDCMTHRTFVTALWIEASDAEIVDTIEETGLSRFPVYGEDMDDVLGVLTTRDYLLNARREQPKPLSELIRPAFFVPESARTDRLLQEMQARKAHMAIVVDEYGGMSGLITMEDLLEEIVGNIYDEFDPLVVQDIVPLPDGRFRVTGSTKLEALAEAMDIDLPEDEEYDTLGGLVFSQLTTIPEDGTQPEVECYGLRIQVEEIADRRVAWAIVERLEAAKPK
ncbi:MAG: HlyC/CorC family transporter [Clostridiales bacterium]|nr:HlyC/CorC family transporter [Clostridiales bacterium]